RLAELYAILRVVRPALQCIRPKSSLHTEERSKLRHSMRLMKLLPITRFLLLCSALAASGLAISAQRAPYAAGHVTSPRLFAEGVISTEDDEINGSFSPDGSEYFFAKVNLSTTFPRLGILCVSRFRHGRWSEPEVLPFSGGQHLDLSPRMSPDGTTMFFSSSRPIPDSAARVLRVWSVKRDSENWGEPHPLPAPVNTV